VTSSSFTPYSLATFQYLHNPSQSPRIASNFSDLNLLFIFYIETARYNQLSLLCTALYRFRFRAFSFYLVFNGFCGVYTEYQFFFSGLVMQCYMIDGIFFRNSTFLCFLIGFGQIKSWCELGFVFVHCLFAYLHVWILQASNLIVDWKLLKRINHGMLITYGCILCCLRLLNYCL
jgi:hypothetical protein